ncbi:hypothetical protein [Yersinia pekkanenii]|uniref:Uncharacterized protein n=1 Tax=Yersinia pekkanenii TaxID=1288385 RepID=A0ABP2A201_9GAMM|nr:hypothetical protein [Yersinia pekkanenii]CRY69565.1 Uncharacterised protein [Yersinia pekkanenii]
MTNSTAFTSICPKSPDAFTGKQKKYWVEIQLVDELGKPVAGMPYKVENDETRCKHSSSNEGQSDSNGLIRIDQLHWLDLTLTIDAQKLADEMETRPLGSHSIVIPECHCTDHRILLPFLSYYHDTFT